MKSQYVYKMLPFSSIGDIRKMKPCGGGGTDYSCIFRYINNTCSSHPPTSIVVITDGEGDYPDEAVANNIPVLWLINGKAQPPWETSVTVSS